MKLKSFLALMSAFGTLVSIPLVAQTETTPQLAPNMEYNPKYDPAMLKASSQASADWLKLVDDGKYGDSWDQGAVIFKLTMPKDEWNLYLSKVRGNEGSVSSREIADQRVSTNPQGLPQGSYIVMVYDTKFSNGNSANELVTLQNEDGTWRVMGYYIKNK